MANICSTEGAETLMMQDYLQRKVSPLRVLLNPNEVILQLVSRDSTVQMTASTLKKLFFFHKSPSISRSLILLGRATKRIVNRSKIEPLKLLN